MTSSSDEARSIAKEAIVFAYAMLFNYKTLWEQAQDYLFPGYIGGFNRYRHYARSYTAADTDIVTANNDTPYSWAWFDLRREPVVLRVPAVPRDRYYVVQLIDLFTYNYGYIGVRATGYEAGVYLLAGPNWDGPVTDDVNQVIRSETEIVLTLTRTSLAGPEDLPNVRAVQRQLIIQPLSEFSAAVPPPPAPSLEFPAWDEQRALSAGFIGYLNFLLQFVAPYPSEAELYVRFAKIGIGPGRPFHPSTLPKELIGAIEAGAADGLKAIDDVAAHTTSSTGLFGTREFLKNDYMKRAVAAKMGIYGNTAEEAVYEGTRLDATGQQLTGASRYVWRFDRDQLPPVTLFWSATLYRLPERLLAANPIDRYSIGDRTPGLAYGKDGSLEIYLQDDAPSDADQRANWLPTPEGPFTVIVRLYGPKEEVLSGRWKLPMPSIIGQGGQ